GLFLPVNSDTQTVGNEWFAFGAEYRLAKLNEMEDYRSSCSLSVDYFSRNSVSVTPILLNYVIHEKALSGFFASAGVGVAFDHGLGASNTHFAYQGGVGYDLPLTGVPLFLEGKFWGNDNSRFNGFGLYVGVHF
ncbi:MAG TPA: hypothetical protein VG944_12500, partial [Fimbriimonas sp.]|nr:hypothetical protein [Fimbriimonas sp.]